MGVIRESVRENEYDQNTLYTLKALQKMHESREEGRVRGVIRKELIKVCYMHVEIYQNETH